MSAPHLALSEFGISPTLRMHYGLMYEFHGWFQLRESPLATNEGENLREIIERIRQRMSGEGWYQNYWAEIRPMNGEYFLYVGGNQNRRGVMGDKLDAFLSWVAKEAPGSYGLLYWIDHDTSARLDQFGYQVNVMARGIVTTRLDPFLSPIVPTVEDEIVWPPEDNFN